MDLLTIIKKWRKWCADGYDWDSFPLTVEEIDSLIDYVEGYYD